MTGGLVLDLRSPSELSTWDGKRRILPERDGEGDALESLQCNGYSSVCL